MQCARSHCDYCVSMGKCCTRCISSPENSIAAKIPFKAAWLPLSLSLSLSLYILVLDRDQLVGTPCVPTKSIH